MKIGIVGYQGSGKSTLFQWLTGVAPDAAQAHTGQSAMAPIPDARIAPLCEIYHPKKITQAALEIVDTPGLSRTHEGNAQRLAQIREAGCLVLVVAGFAGADPEKDRRGFAEDLLLADLEIVLSRVEKLRESVKKPRPNREKELEELALLEPLVAILEAGRPLSSEPLSDEQLKATRSFRLFTEKPWLIVVNVADPDDRRKYGASAESVPIVALPLSLEVELSQMAPEDRAAFEADLGLQGARRDELLGTLLNVSGQMLYFTAGEKEVRTWLLPKGGTALEAAANIHTDLARGFIRAEVMTCDDLIRVGSEREIKAQHLLRQEPKDYVVRDGDILHVRFSV